MNRAARRQGGWLLLVGYLFSVTAAFSFHDHGKANWSDQSRCHDGCDSGDHSVAESGAALASVDFGARRVAGRSEGHFEGSTGHTCAVCQFLSQKFVAARPVEAVRSEALCELPISAGPARPVCSPLLVHHSRAPPSFA
jgi:hypothetical protein